MSFGFSAGDFIAALSLIDTVISSLRETSDSATQFRELVNEIYGLETALLRVKQLELEEAQRSEYVALRQVAAQCQGAIDRFLKSIRKYQKHLGNETTGLKATWMKVQWVYVTRRMWRSLRAKSRLIRSRF